MMGHLDKISIVLLLLIISSFSQVAALSDSKVSAGFALAQDPFKDAVINSANDALDPVKIGGSIKTAYISSAGQDLATVNLQSTLGEYVYFKNRIVPIFSDCVGMTCTVDYQATPTVDYAYQAGDFTPILDVGNGQFRLVNISYNISVPTTITDYGFINTTINYLQFNNATGKFDNLTILKSQTWGVVGSHPSTAQGWADISTLSQKAGAPITIRIIVARDRMNSTADIQPRAYGQIMSQWGLYTATRNQVRYVNVSNSNNHTANTTVVVIDKNNAYLWNSTNGGAWDGKWLNDCRDFYITGAGNTTNNPSSISDWDTNFSLSNSPGATACSWDGTNPNITAVVNLSSATGGGLPAGAWTTLAFYYNSSSTVSAFPANNNATTAADIGYICNDTTISSSYWASSSFSDATGTTTQAWAKNGSSCQLGAIFATGTGWAGQLRTPVPILRGNTTSPYYTIRTTVSTWTGTNPSDFLAVVGFYNNSAGAGQSDHGIGPYSSGLLKQTDFLACCAINKDLTQAKYTWGSNYTYYWQRNSIGNRTENLTLYNNTNTSIVPSGQTTTVPSPTIGFNVGYTVKMDTTGGSGNDYMRIYNVFAYNNFDNFTFSAITTPNATAMVSAGTGVNPINTNSPIGWNASAAVSGGGSFRGFNWTIYKNGVNVSSGNYTCNGGFCNNNTIYVIQNDSPSIYGIGDQLIFSARAYTTDTVLNSSYLNSTTYTVVDTKPVITNLLIAANSTTDTIYPNMTINGNVTAQDNDTGQTLTASYSWYKNGVNQTSLAGTLTLFNGTANTTPLNCLSVGCVVGDSWIFGVQVNDTLNWTAPLNTSATVITAHLSNITMNSTTFEYDLYTYSHGFNLTASPGITITAVSASLTGTGSTFAGIKQGSSSGGAQQWNISIQPPFTAGTINYTVGFIISGTYANGTAFTLTNISNANTTNPYSVQVNSSGLGLCNATWNTPAINYSTFDQSTLVSINATYAITYSILSSNGSVKTTTASFTNNTQTICIGPSTASFSANATESLNASGYQGSTVSEIQQFYNSSVTVRPMYLINNSAVNLMTITVETPQLQPFANYIVQLYRYIPATNSYNLTNTGVTNGQGQTVQAVLGPPTTYAVLTYDNMGNLVQNLTTPAQIFCASVPVGSTCTYNIVIGGGTTTYYSSTTNYFDLSALCSFNNATDVLTCTYSGDPATATYILNTLNLTAINGSAASGAIVTTNATAYSVASVPSHTITVTIPNVTGNYPFNFMGYYAGTQNGSTLTGYKLYAQGVIQINVPTTQSYGKDGWFMVGILVMVMGLLLAAAGGPLVGIVGAGGTILLSAIAGFIYLDPITFGGIAILTLIVGLWAKG